MPRDNDKNNDSRRGRRDRPSDGKGRSGAARGPEKKLAKRGFGNKDFAGKRDGAKRSFGANSESRPFRQREDAPPRRGDSDRPRFDRDAPRRGDRPDREAGKNFRPREDRGGETRPYTPRGEGFRKDGRRPPPSDRADGARPPRDGTRPRGVSPRGDSPRGDSPHGDRPAKKFGGDRKFSRGAPDRGPRKDFGDRPGRGRDQRGDEKPWRKRDERGGPVERPKFGDRPPAERSDRDRPKFDRPRGDRPKFDRPRGDRKSGPGDRQSDRGEHREGRTFERPREARNAWQEHPRSDARSSDRQPERPRRDNEVDSKIFVKRPAFGGRGAYRERPAEQRRAPRPPREKKSGERIAKVVSRAGLASRRDAEEWIVQGRVTVNGRVINSPALDVTANDVITVDGKPLPARERTRLFLYHKPRGLMTTHADPEGRPTVFDNLPEGLPRLISIGRLDFNTEGLLLLTNDGGLARALELPDTGWLRRYRVRAHGEVTQAQLDQLQQGIEVDGVKYGPIDATLERDQGANVWLVFAIREGKNREVRNVLAHLGLEVNRLIRVSYGPFQLGELAEGAVEEVKTRVLREQLGEKIAKLAGADFTRPSHGKVDPDEEEHAAPRGNKSIKPAGKSGLIADRKGRRVLVQRTGSEEARARNEAEANGYGPPRRPQRGYHGKRDLKARDE
jgi:23S rRNA pseudouridine2605 synthase